MDIQQITSNLYRIPIPVPFPMKYVYCYLFKGTEEVTLIDTGLNYSPAQEAWKEAFVQLDVNPNNVGSIYITHFHPDHFGLAGWLQEWTGASVFMSEEDRHMVDRVWAEGSLQAKRIKTAYIQHGMPEELAQQVEEQMVKLNKLVRPLAVTHVLSEQQVVLGDEYWQVIHTPGHSDGHLCFYQQDKRILIAADHILDKITPNISLWPGCRKNPLQDYLDSLISISSLDVKQVLPGHGNIITQLPLRVAEIIEHHEERIEQMHAVAKERTTAYEVAQSIFGHKDLNPHQWRFAMAETLAHLEFLVAKGSLLKTGNDEEGYIYSAAIHESTGI